MLLPLAAVSSCIYDGAKGTKALYGREKGIMGELAIAMIVFACVFAARCSVFFFELCCLSII
jgi:hypothetical protein